MILRLIKIMNYFHITLIFSSKPSTKISAVIKSYLFAVSFSLSSLLLFLNNIFCIGS